MRISDWSSNVCSSDLLICAMATRAALMDDGSRSVEYRHKLSHAGAGRRLGAFVRQRPLARHVAPQRHAKADRKSVVQGTSVSVRVDNGGRRIVTNTQDY